jgi:hypothetical protein
MMAKRTSRRGRPPGGEFTGKSVVANFRVRPETKALLEKAAQASGRTVSQEFEHRLLRGLDDFENEPMTAVLKIFDLAMDTVSKSYDPTGRARWWNDPLLYAVAERTLVGTFHMLRPPGPAPAADDISFQQMEDMGTHTKNMIWRRIQLVDETKSYARLSKSEVWYSMLRKELGPPVADRPVIWGKSAEELRKEHAELDAIRPLMKQLSPLEDIPKDARTPEQENKIEQLRNQMSEITAKGKSS